MSEDVQIVSAVVRRRDHIALVRHQGSDDREAVWALPGGLLEPGDVLTEALVREVREETGLQITDPGQLVYVAQIHNPTDRGRSPGGWPRPGGRATVFVWEVAGWEGDLRASDADEFVSTVRFFPADEVLDRLRKLPWAFMREPVVAYLSGEADFGHVWLYRRDAGGDNRITTGPIGSVPVAPAVEMVNRASSRQTSSKPSFQTSILTLGCMIIVLLLAVIVVVGIIAAATH